MEPVVPVVTVVTELCLIGKIALSGVFIRRFLRFCGLDGIQWIPVNSSGLH